MRKLAAIILVIGLLLVVGSVVAGAAVVDGLIGYWDFDADLLDTSNSAVVHNGTYSSTGAGPVYISGAGNAMFGQAIDLPGASAESKVVLDDTSDFHFQATHGGNVSISAWFRVDAWDQGWQAVVVKGEGGAVRLHNHPIHWNVGPGGDLNSGYNTPAGSGFHHLVATRNAAGHKEIWIDGALRASADNAGNIDDRLGRSLMIGANPDDGGGRRWFNGVFDDVAIWSRPLTAGEIGQIWNGGAGAPISSFQVAGTLSSFASGNWNTPATWELDGGGAGNTQPPTADYATIVYGHTVTVAANGAGDSLTIDDPVAAVQINSGQTLTIDNNVSIDQGSMNIDGTLTAGNKVEVASGASLTAPGTLNAAEVNTAGTTLLTGGGTVGTVNVTGGTTTLATPTITTLDVSGGVLESPGINVPNFTIGAGGTANTSGAVSADNFTLAGVLNRTGVGADRNVTVTTAFNLASTLDMTGGGTLSTPGTVNVAGGGTLRMNQAMTAAEITVAGTVEMQGANITPSGDLRLSGGTLRSSGTVHASSSGGDVRVSGKPNLNVTSGHLTVDVPAGGSMPPDLIGYWPFENGSGTIAYDQSGAGHDGNITGAAWVNDPTRGSVLDFEGADYVDIPAAAAAFAPIAASQAVTISLWQYGDAAIQPQSDTIFQGTNGGRQLSSHIPWNNSNVYWDAFGNYDRINKGAAASEFEGQWNHWVFTKDQATGTMDIYLNGNPWHSGTGMTRTFGNITAFKIGSTSSGGENYDGMIDDFAVFNRKLTLDEIQALFTGSGVPAFGTLMMAAGSELTLGGGGEASFDSIVAGDGATIHGSVSAGDDVRVGSSVGTLNIDGNYTQGAGSTYHWEFDNGGSDTIAVNNGNLDTSADWNLEVIPLHPAVAVNGEVLMSRTGSGTTSDPGAGVTVSMADNVYADLYDASGASVVRSGDNIVLQGMAFPDKTISWSGGAWGVSGSWDNGVPDVTKAAVVAGGTVASSAAGAAKDLAVAGGDLVHTGGTLAVSNNVRIGAGSELTVDAGGTPGAAHVSVGAEAKVHAGGTLHLVDGGTLGSTVKILDQGTLKTSGDMNLPGNVEFDPNGTLHVARDTLTIAGGSGGPMTWDFEGNTLANTDGTHAFVPDGIHTNFEGNGFDTFTDGVASTPLEYSATAANTFAGSGSWYLGSDSARRPDGTYQYNGDNAPGQMETPTFVLGNDAVIDFMIGGGNRSYERLKLVRASDDVVLFENSNTGDSWTMNARQWDASAYAGEEVYLRIWDGQTGGWAFVFVDNIVVSSTGGSEFGNLRVDTGATLLNTGTGALSVNDLSGGGTVDSSIAVAGQTSPGDSPGLLTVTGDMTLADGAGYLWELGGSTSGLPGAGTDYDSVSVGGSLTMDGDWSLTLLDAGGSADPTDLFYLFTGFTGQTGTITPLVDASMMDPANWDVSGLTFGVDQTGLYMTGLSGGAIIPEPSTVVLMILGGLGLLAVAWRRRK